MNTNIKPSSGRGGKREGAGRKPLPDGERKKNSNVKVTPKGEDVWVEASKKLGLSKGDAIMHLIAHGNDELPKYIRDKALKELS